TLELDRAAEARVLRQQRRHGEHAEALAGPRLADDSEAFTPLQRQVDAPHSREGTGTGPDRHGEVGDLEERGAAGIQPIHASHHELAVVRTSNRSRKPSPMKENARTTVSMATPGPSATHH